MKQLKIESEITGVLKVTAQMHARIVRGALKADLCETSLVSFLKTIIISVYAPSDRNHRLLWIAFSLLYKSRKKKVPLFAMRHEFEKTAQLLIEWISRSSSSIIWKSWKEKLFRNPNYMGHTIAALFADFSFFPLPPWVVCSIPCPINAFRSYLKIWWASYLFWCNQSINQSQMPVLPI